MGFFDKLKNGLFKTKSAIVGKIDNLFKKFWKVDEELSMSLRSFSYQLTLALTQPRRFLTSFAKPSRKTN